MTRSSAMRSTWPHGIEDLIKYYGVSLIASNDLFQQLIYPDKYHYRFLSKAQVKGKQIPIPIYEFYDGDPQEIIDLKLKTKPDFEAGLELYFSKEFAETAVCFKRVLKKNPEDKTAQLYLQNSARFMVQGAPDDWQGIEMMVSK